MSYIENPKMKSSGLIDCIPQTIECPEKCEDCFFQSGRSYLEPLKDNLPNIPTPAEALHKVVAMNRGGNDSSNNRDLVEHTALGFKDSFFNTASPDRLGEYPGPVVLTVNPGNRTDTNFYWFLNRGMGYPLIPENLMFVRVRTNTWNIDEVVVPAVHYYTTKNVRVVLTFMAYYTTPIPNGFKKHYKWEVRTSNPYWVLKQKYVRQIEERFEHNPLVYTCGYKGTHDCKSCGNCIREYYNTVERIKSYWEK